MSTKKKDEMILEPAPETSEKIAAAAPEAETEAARPAREGEKGPDIQSRMEAGKAEIIKILGNTPGAGVLLPTGDAPPGRRPQFG